MHRLTLFSLVAIAMACSTRANLVNDAAPADVGEPSSDGGSDIPDAGINDATTKDASDGSVNDASMLDGNTIIDGGFEDVNVVDVAPDASADAADGGMNPTGLMLDMSFESVNLTNSIEARISEAGWELWSNDARYTRAAITRVGALVNDPLDGVQTAYFGFRPNAPAGTYVLFQYRSGHFATAGTTYELRFLVGDPLAYPAPGDCEASIAYGSWFVSGTDFSVPTDGRVSEVIVSSTTPSNRVGEEIRVNIRCDAVTNVGTVGRRLLVDHVRVTEL